MFRVIAACFVAVLTLGTAMAQSQPLTYVSGFGGEMGTFNQALVEA